MPLLRTLAGALLLAVTTAAAAAPADRCDDATFLRRATLDLLGRQPTPDEIESFLADAAADKRSAAVDRMLADPAWARTWARYFRDVILFRRSDDRALAMALPLERFFEARLRDDASWAALAHDMITATGSPAERGETAIIMAQMGETADVAAAMSRVFLGVQIQCAQCHDHFTDRWKRRQFHEFAAFFPRVEIRRGMGTGLDRFEVVSRDEPPRRGKGAKPANALRGELEHRMPDRDDPSRPGTVVTPTFFLTGASLPTGTSDMRRRRTVARWISVTDNPWFARAIVNRVHAELVGDGFYAGIDDLGPDREPRDPDTLAALCRTFVAADHDLRVLFRAVTALPAYQTASRSRSHAGRVAAGVTCPQRLRADQAFAQVLRALGAEEAEAAGRGPAGRGTQVRAPRNAFEQAFGFDPSLPREEVAGTIPQALLLMNSQPLARALDAERRSTVLGRLLAEHGDDRAVADALHLRTLARHATPDELQACVDHVRATGDRADAFEDVFWALVNSAEFIHRK